MQNPARSAAPVSRVSVYALSQVTAPSNPDGMHANFSCFLIWRNFWFSLSNLQRTSDRPLRGFARVCRILRSEERRVGIVCRFDCDWSSDVCSSDLCKTLPEVQRQFRAYRFTP